MYGVGSRKWGRVSRESDERISKICVLEIV